MDLNTFWVLVERSAVEASDQDERPAWLARALAARPVSEIADFAAHPECQRVRVDTWRHWLAATLICGGLCGMDGFFYFQAWLVGLGRSAFEAVADEALQAAGFGGDVDSLLESRGLRRSSDVDPSGEEVEMEDPADVARRVPRLWAMFGKAA